MKRDVQDLLHLMAEAESLSSARNAAIHKELVVTRASESVRDPRDILCSSITMVASKLTTAQTEITIALNDGSNTSPYFVKHVTCPDSQAHAQTLFTCFDCISSLGTGLEAPTLGQWELITVKTSATGVDDVVRVWNSTSRSDATLI